MDGIASFRGHHFVAASVYVVVVALAKGERAFFKAVLPGILPPLKILFALFVAFPLPNSGPRT
jgi:hypothetical protein